MNEIQKAVVDQVSTTVKYQGRAYYGNGQGVNNAPDPASRVWRIVKEVRTGTVTEMLLPIDTADQRVSQSFAFAWSNRALYIYA